MVRPLVQITNVEVPTPQTQIKNAVVLAQHKIPSGFRNIGEGIT